MPNVISLYDHKGETEQELDFSKDQDFELLNNSNADWYVSLTRWFVKNTATGEKGYVPSNFMGVVIEQPDSSNLEQEKTAISPRINQHAIKKDEHHSSETGSEESFESDDSRSLSDTETSESNAGNDSESSEDLSEEEENSGSNG